MTVYKCLHGLAPPYLAVDCVSVTSLPSRRHLRSAESGCLAVTGTRTTLGSRNFAVAGAKIWNSLPVDLRLLSQSLRTFGHKLKHYLFVNEPLGFLKSALYKFSHYYYYYYLTVHKWLVGDVLFYLTFTAKVTHRPLNTGTFRS